MKCISCSKELEWHVWKFVDHDGNPLPIDPEDKYPDGWNLKYMVGNYGSTVWDASPALHGEIAAFGICDACFKVAASDGRIQKLPYTSEEAEAGKEYPLPK